MSQNSYPKVDAPFTDDQWKNLFLTLGRGIIDKGGFPYKLTNRDSVTNKVTIGVDSRDGRNYAVLDGFLHFMDTAEDVDVPAVTVDTTYEIGLVYDPTQHAAEGGPITLTAWVAPGDNTGGKSRLVFYRMTRKNNLSLGSTPYTAERPRVAPVFTVSYETELPRDSVVLVDSVGIIRTTGELFRAEIAENGAVTWVPTGAGGGNGTYLPTPDTVVRRSSSGAFRAVQGTHTDDVATVGWVNSKGYSWSQIASKPTKFPSEAHTHPASEIREGGELPWEAVTGSKPAYTNTNLGSTWATVAVSSAGRLGRYPSALKYKKNVRQWSINPDTVYGLTPVKYEDKENGDTRVGFVADSQVNALPELVETNPETGEVEGWKYMLTCVAQQVAIRDLNDRLKTTETMLEGVLERLADLETGTL